jgi:hypothetical protein
MIKIIDKGWASALCSRESWTTHDFDGQLGTYCICVEWDVTPDFEVNLPTSLRQKI